MTSKTITLSGVAYVRSRDAARTVHLSPDYVSRLARANLIDGKLVNGLWYVNEQSLAAFLVDQERQKNEWRAHLSQLRKDEQQRLGHPSALFA